jgi:hypothetical protein
MYIFILLDYEGVGAILGRRATEGAFKCRGPTGRAGAGRHVRTTVPRARALAILASAAVPCLIGMPQTSRSNGSGFAASAVSGGTRERGSEKSINQWG